MAFVSACCNQCGSEIPVDSSKEKGFCLHCGSPIIVKEAIANLKVGISGSVSVYHNQELENYLTILNRSIDNWLDTPLRKDGGGRFERLTSLGRIIGSEIDKISKLDPNNIFVHEIKICLNVLNIISGNPYSEVYYPSFGKKVVLNRALEHDIFAWVDEINAESKTILSIQPQFSFETTTSLLNKIFAKNENGEFEALFGRNVGIGLLGMRDYVIPGFKKHIHPPLGAKLAQCVETALNDVFQKNDQQKLIDNCMKMKVKNADDLQLLK